MQRLRVLNEHLTPNEVAATQTGAAAAALPALLSKEAQPLSKWTGPAPRAFDSMPGPWLEKRGDKLGNTDDIMASRTKAAHLWRRWQLEHGDLYRYSFMMFTGGHFKSVTVVVIADPELANSFLAHNEVEKSESYHDFLLVGDGVLSSTNYDEWKMQRALLKPAFAMENLKQLMPGIVTATAKTLSLLNKAVADKTSVDLLEELPRLTFEIIGHAALGEDPEFVQTINEKLRDAFETCLEKPFEAATIENDEEFKSAYEYMLAFANDVIDRAEQRDVTASSAAQCPVKHHGKTGLVGVLDIVRQKDEKGQPLFKPKLQQDNLFTTLFAGHETTANTLGWLFAELSRRPAVQDELRASIMNTAEFARAKVAAKAAGAPEAEAYRFLSYAEIHKFDFLTKCINETLRRWPVVAIGTFRMLREDYVIGGYTVPKGTHVRTPHICIHLHPGIWEDPLEWNPHRKWHAEAFLPFSRGHRDCLGRNLALLEARLITIALLTNFRFRAQRPEKPLDIFELVTIRPRGGLPVLVDRA